MAKSRPLAPVSVPLSRGDDWQNVAAGFGSIRDKHTATTYGPRRRMTRQQLTWLYGQSWICARIVDKIVDDAFRATGGPAWRFKSIDADVDEAEIHSRLAAWKLEPSLRRLLKWGRLYGGALLLYPTIGTGAPDKPLDLRAPQALYRPQVVIADDALPVTMDVGFGSPTFQEVLEYDVTGLLTSTVRVHSSRTAKHEPIDLPLEALLDAPNRWGPSVVERPYPEIERDGAAAGHAVAMMYIASVLYVRLKGLRDEGKANGGKERVKAILADCRQSLDALGLLGLDAADEIGNLSVQASSVHELARLIRDRVAACVDGMPREILFNESPTGLRGGELSGAQAIWNGTVDAFRRETVEPLLDRSLELAFACWGVKAESWEYEWSPLFRPDAQAEAAIYLQTMQADAVGVDKGIIEPNEIREQRLVQGKASGPIRVEPGTKAEPLALGEPDVEAYQAAEAAPVAAEAMNGAQISSLVEVASNPALSREQKIGIISVAFPTITGPQLEAVVGPVVVAGPDDGPEADSIEQAPIEPGDRIKIQEAAKLYGVPTAAISAAIRRGELRSIGLGAHKIVSKRELQALASGGPAVPEPQPGAAA
jgi:phage-related protein (TIGR01555 family)